MLALALFAPARWLAALAQQASAGRVQLLAPRGTLWEGSAQLVLTGGAGSRDAMALPGEVSWRLRPVWNGVTLQLSANAAPGRPCRSH